MFYVQKGQRKMKQTICSVLGVIGSAIASFGGWDAGLTTLLIFMGLDYISGLIVAGCSRTVLRQTQVHLKARRDGKVFAESAWPWFCTGCVPPWSCHWHKLHQGCSNYCVHCQWNNFPCGKCGSYGVTTPRRLSPRLLIFYRKKTESEGE